MGAYYRTLTVYSKEANSVVIQAFCADVYWARLVHTLSFYEFVMILNNDCSQSTLFGDRYDGSNVPRYNTKGSQILRPLANARMLSKVIPGQTIVKQGI